MATFEQGRSLPTAFPTHAQLLLSQYLALNALLERRGIEMPDLPSQEEATTMASDPHTQVVLGRWVRMMRDVLRTPLD